MQITQLQYAKTSNRFLFAHKFDGNFDYVGIIERNAFFEWNVWVDVDLRGRWER